jgi:hypothetical protein
MDYSKEREFIESKKFSTNSEKITYLINEVDKIRIKLYGNKCSKNLSGFIGKSTESDKINYLINEIITIRVLLYARSHYCCYQNCGKRSNHLHICSRCHEMYYCSRDCQVKDWEEHKKICGH